TRVLAAGLCAAVVGIVAALVAGCAAPVTGSAAAVDPVGPPAAAGRPGPGVTPPPDDPDGRLVEAVRLASATPVVPELVAGRPLPCGAAGPHTDPVRVEDGMGEVGTVAPILEKYGFVAS